MDFTNCEILNGSRTKTGIVVIQHLAPDGQTPQESKFTDIRGAFSFPGENSPFYSVIFGMPHIDKFTELKDPFYVLLAEWTDTGFDLEQRYSRLADDAILYCCDWYVDWTPKYEGDRESFYDHRSRHPGRKYGDLLPASYSDRFRLGLELLKTMTARNKLDLPKTSTLYEQLTRFSADNLKAKKVSQEFYAINAARFVIASFKQEPPIIREFSGRRGSTSGDSWLGA